MTFDQWQENGDPTEPGWYVVRREDGSLGIKAFGRGGLWWIPLVDGWFSSHMLPGHAWMGPIAELDWETPKQRAAKDEQIKSALDNAKVPDSEDDAYDFAVWRACESFHGVPGSASQESQVSGREGGHG